MEKKSERRWKYKNGRRHVPEASLFDVAVMVMALQQECEDNLDRLKPLRGGVFGKMYETEYAYWKSCHTFLTTRLTQGISSLPDRRWKQVTILATVTNSIRTLE